MGGVSCVAKRTPTAADSEQPLFPLMPFHSRYALGKKLGQGAFSTVYAATSITFGGDIAVKVTDLRAKHGGVVTDVKIDMETKEAFQMEVEVLKHLHGKDRCIQLQEECTEGFLSYAVMERCEFSLCQAFESLPELNERTLVPFVKGMLQALEVIHDARVVHRDIKPDNFLCSGEDMKVKLCDFGLAKIMPSETCSSLSGVFGTSPFMSPEMIGNRGYGAATDLWSVGVIVYVMIFGRFPYEPERHSNNAMKQAILAGLPAPSFKLPKAVEKETTQKPDISKHVVAFVRELLERNPVCRPSARESLNMLWISLPESGETRSARCLQQALQAAKTIGAFHPKAQTQKDDQPDDLDVLLAQADAKYVSRQDSKNTASTTASSRQSSKDTVSTTAWSRELSDELNGSQVSTAIAISGGLQVGQPSKSGRPASNSGSSATSWAS